MFLIVSAASAATLTVCSTCTYSAVQDALDAAASGDQISISNGTWTEDLRIIEDVTIDGGDEAKTIIAGTVTIENARVSIRRLTVSPTGRGFDLASSRLRLSRVTVNGAYPTSSYDPLGGSSIPAEDYRGGGLRALDSAVVLSSCTFDDNQIYVDNMGDRWGYGGHLSADASTILIRNSAFSNAHVNTRGGAIYALNGSAVSIADSDFTANSVGGYGFGAAGSTISVVDSELRVVSSNFEANEVNGSAVYGGVIHVTDTATLIRSSSFTDNVAEEWFGGTVDGHGVAAYGGALRVYYTTFAGHTGDEIYADSDVDPLRLLGNTYE